MMSTPIVSSSSGHRELLVEGHGGAGALLAVGAAWCRRSRCGRGRRWCSSWVMALPCRGPPARDGAARRGALAGGFANGRDSPEGPGARPDGPQGRVSRSGKRQARRAALRATAAPSWRRGRSRALSRLGQGSSLLSATHAGWSHGAVQPSRYPGTAGTQARRRAPVDQEVQAQSGTRTAADRENRRRQIVVEQHLSGGPVLEFRQHCRIEKSSGGCRRSGSIRPPPPRRAGCRHAPGTVQRSGEAARAERRGRPAPRDRGGVVGADEGGEQRVAAIPAAKMQHPGERRDERPVPQTWAADRRTSSPSRPGPSRSCRAARIATRDGVHGDENRRPGPADLGHQRPRRPAGIFTRAIIRIRHRRDEPPGLQGRHETGRLPVAQSDIAWSAVRVGGRGPPWWRHA